MKGLSAADTDMQDQPEVFMRFFFFLDLFWSFSLRHDSLIIRQLWETDRGYLTFRGRWGTIYLHLRSFTLDFRWTLPPWPRSRYATPVFLNAARFEEKREKMSWIKRWWQSKFYSNGITDGGSDVLGGWSIGGESGIICTSGSPEGIHDMWVDV